MTYYGITHIARMELREVMWSGKNKSEYILQSS